MMRQIWNNPSKYEEYFRLEGWYISGDSAYMDEDGYFWFQGRVDDVINTAGERVGPFEVESKLVEHPAVAEAGVIGKPDPLRGEIIKAFINLREAIMKVPNCWRRFASLSATGCPRTRAPGIRGCAQTAQNQIRQNHAPGTEGPGIRPAHRRPFHIGRLNLNIGGIAA